MKLIIGGANQGKFEYAKENYHLSDEMWCDGRYCEREAIFLSPYILHLESYIKRQLQDGINLSSFAEELIKKNSNAFILTDEIGMGLVPMDENDRLYRETTGRICTKLCAFASKVERVSYGIGMVIKDDKDSTSSTR